MPRTGNILAIYLPGCLPNKLGGLKYTLVPLTCHLWQMGPADIIFKEIARRLRRPPTSDVEMDYPRMSAIGICRRTDTLQFTAAARGQSGQLGLFLPLLRGELPSLAIVQIVRP